MNCKHLQEAPDRAMLRGHIWTSPTFSMAAQEAVLKPMCCAVYADEIKDAIKSLRAGNRLVVVTFRGLGRDRETIAENLREIHSKGCAAMDAETERLSIGKDRKTLVDEAMKAIGNERRGPRKDRRKACMPWDQAARFYFDPRLRNREVEEAVANGYRPMSYHTMWRHFKKPRGAPVGRPSECRAAQF